MTPQQLFDNALFGIRGQGYQRSATKTNGCFYRGPNGLKCALGFSIDDATATEWDKYGDPQSVIDAIGVENVPAWVPENLQLLIDLQNAHDGALREGPQAWSQRMKEIATHYGLAYTPSKEN